MHQQKKIITIVGARPQLIKCAALSPALKKYFNQKIIHTGQHYQNELSGNLIKELGMPEPDYCLDISGGSGLSQIGRMLLSIESVFQKEQPDLVIVFGDTNSTAAGAICASKCGVPIAHIEAGMREFDKSIPEESNKLITSVLSDYHFCPSPSAVKWLAEMGIHQNVFLCGDVMLDLIDEHTHRIEHNKSVFEKYGVREKEFVFVTVHRAANTDNLDNLREIVGALEQINLALIWPIHPRTKIALEKSGIHKLKPHIIQTEPIGWLDTQTLIKSAAFVVTDSGGVTKEAFHHRTPGILVDKQTEWVETVEQGWNIQAGPDMDKILEVAGKMKIPNFHHGYNNQGKASTIIAETLLQKIGT